MNKSDYISDDFLKTIMSDSKKIVEKQNESINESQHLPKDIGSNKSSSSTKAYLMEQIEAMEQQIFHLKSVIGRL